jgi:hypothetical protein
MKFIIIIISVFILLIPLHSNATSFDCARNYDLMQSKYDEFKLKSMSYQDLHPLDDELAPIVKEHIENRCGITISLWAHESLYPDRIKNVDWEYESHVNQLVLGEIEPTNETDKIILESSNIKMSKIKQVNGNDIHVSPYPKDCNLQQETYDRQREYYLTSDNDETKIALNPIMNYLKGTIGKCEVNILQLERQGIETISINTAGAYYMPINVETGFMEITCPVGFLENNGICVVKSQSDLKDTKEKNDISCGTGTIEKDGMCIVDTHETKSSKGGGCLIATATYGSEMAIEVQQLRELRDNTLLNTESGTIFMKSFNNVYYSFSPTIADMEREHPMFKEAVKLAITPMISSLSLMENAESESEVLSIGISVIMLNLGMYLGVPAIVIVGIRKTVNS